MQVDSSSTGDSRAMAARQEKYSSTGLDSPLLQGGMGGRDNSKGLPSQNSLEELVASFLMYLKDTAYRCPYFG